MSISLTTQTGIDNAIAQGKTPEQIRGLDYIETAELCGVVLTKDEKGHWRSPAGFSYEVERERIARAVDLVLNPPPVEEGVQ